METIRLCLRAWSKRARALACLGALAAAFAQPTDNRINPGRLKLVIVDAETGRPTPARVEVLDEKAGSHFAIDALLVGGDCRDQPAPWSGTLEEALARLSPKVINRYAGTEQFYSGGECTLSLAPGTYSIKAQKGFEYRIQKQTVRIEAGRSHDVTLKLGRWSNLPAQGWYGSDSHLHIARPLPDLNFYVSKWMQAEDIHVANLLEWGHSKGFHNALQYAHGPAGLYHEGNYWLAPGQENPRTHFLGHTMILGAARKIDHPGSYVIYENFWTEARLQKALSGFCHFALNSGAREGMAIDLLDDLLNFIEVMQDDAGVYDVWYHALNLGVRLAPIAGTDYPCGRWRQLPGRERFYTQVKGPFTYEAWLEGVRRGRTFVTNGPMIGLSIDGKGLGEEVMLQKPGRVRVKAWARFDPERDDVEQLELVQNGEIVRHLRRTGESPEINWEFEHDLTESAWLALRVAGTKRHEALSPFTRENFDPYQRAGAKRMDELPSLAALSSKPVERPEWKPTSPSVAHSAAIYVTLQNTPGIATHPRARALARAFFEKLDDLEKRLAPDRLAEVVGLRWYQDGVDAGYLRAHRDALVARIQAAKKKFAELARGGSRTTPP